MRKLAQAAPNSIWRHQAAAEAYESQGSTDQAVAEYRAVLAQDPGRPGVHYRIGRTLLSRARHGDSEEDTQAALREFEQELEVDSTNANAAYELGEIYRRAGQFDKAREQFEKAVKSYPDFQQAQLALGGTLLSLDLPDQALPHLKKAAALDPNDDVPYYRLARAYRALGNPQEATKALAEFQRLHDRRESQGGSQQKFEAVDVTKQTADQRDP
jgi:predicted Zn-dependent protease